MTDPIPAPTDDDESNPRRYLGRSVAALANLHGYRLDAEQGQAATTELLDAHQGRHAMPLDHIHEALIASVGFDERWPSIARLRELLRWARDRHAPPAIKAQPNAAPPDVAKAAFAECRAILQRGAAHAHIGYRQLPDVPSAPATEPDIEAEPDDDAPHPADRLDTGDAA